MADAGSGGKDLMPPAEMKPLLAQSKRKPVSCAVGMTKDKQGVVLLDRKAKPRKLMAELRSKAKSEGMDLDAVSVRFGRVAVGADDGTAVFTLNKAAPAALRMKLVEKLRPAGVRKVELGVDEKLEDEADEEEAGGGDGQGDGTAAGGRGPAGARGGAAAGGGAGGGQEATGAGGRGGAGEGADGDAVAGAGQADGPGGQAQANSGDMAPPAAVGGPGTGGDEAPSPGAGRGATDKAAVTRRLAELVRRMLAVLPVNPPNAAEMRAAATAGHKAVQSGDMAGAGQAADTLEKLLGEAEDSGERDDPAGTADVAASDEHRPGSGPASTGPASTGPASTGPGGAGPGNAGLGATGDGTDAPAAPQPGGASPPSGTAPASPTGVPGAAAAGPGAARPARHGPGSPVFDKGRQAWDAVRTKVEGDIQAVLKGVAAEPGVPKDLVRQVHSHVEPIMRQLDGSLAQKLAEIAGGTDAGAHAKLVGEAQAIIERYKAFADGEPMIGVLDQNPIRPMALRKTLDAALLALSKVVQSEGGA